MVRPAVVVLARPDRGLGGAAIAASATVYWESVLTKIIIPMIISPIVGIALGYLVMALILWLFRRAHPGGSRALPLRPDRLGRGDGVRPRLQDASKTAGVVVLALTVGGYHAQATTASRCGFSS